MTPRYVDLLFAFGHVRLGDAETARRLTDAAAGELEATGHAAHAFLAKAFRYRVDEAIAGRAHAGWFPGELGEQTSAWYAEEANRPRPRREPPRVRTTTPPEDKPKTAREKRIDELGASIPPRPIELDHPLTKRYACARLLARLSTLDPDRSTDPYTLWKTGQPAHDQAVWHAAGSGDRLAERLDSWLAEARDPTEEELGQFQMALALSARCDPAVVRRLLAEYGRVLLAVLKADASAEGSRVTESFQAAFRRADELGRDDVAQLVLPLLRLWHDSPRDERPTLRRVVRAAALGLCCCGETEWARGVAELLNEAETGGSAARTAGDSWEASSARVRDELDLGRDALRLAEGASIESVESVAEAFALFAVGPPAALPVPRAKLFVALSATLNRAPVAVVALLLDTLRAAPALPQIFSTEVYYSELHLEVAEALVLLACGDDFRFTTRRRPFTRQERRHRLEALRVSRDVLLKKAWHDPPLRGPLLPPAEWRALNDRVREQIRRLERGLDEPSD